MDLIWGSLPFAVPWEWKTEVTISSTSFGLENRDFVTWLPSNQLVEARGEKQDILTLAFLIVLGAIALLSSLARQLGTSKAIRYNFSYPSLAKILINLSILTLLSGALAIQPISKFALYFLISLLLVTVISLVDVILQSNAAATFSVVLLDMTVLLILIFRSEDVTKFTVGDATIILLDTSKIFISFSSASHHAVANPSSFIRGKAPWIVTLAFSWTEPLIRASRKQSVTRDAVDSVTFSDYMHVYVDEHDSKKFSVTLLDLAKLQWRCLFKASLMQAISSTVAFTTPFLLGTLMQSHSIQVIVAIFAFILLGKLAGQHATYHFNLFGIRIKAIIISRIYRKIPKLIPSALNEGNVVTLVEMDAQKIITMIPILYQYWTLPLQFVASMGGLIYFLGPLPVLSMLVIMIGLLPIAGVLTSKVRYWFQQRMTQTEIRVSCISEMLINIKSIKLHWWQSHFHTKLHDIRATELKMLAYRAIYNAITAGLFMSSNGILIVAGLLIYIHVQGPITSDIIFPSLLMLSLLKMPLTMMGMLIAEYHALASSLQRINPFLGGPERDCFYDNHVSSGVGNGPITAHLHSTKITPIGYTDDDKSNILANVQLVAKKGQLVTICGTVGSGKTSILLALLGDLSVEGDCFINGKTAYVSQTPWIMNTSIRENITCGKPFDAARYEQVIQVCGLTLDLAGMQYGDLKLAGPRGSALSGGQQSRVALARALYSDADVYLFDDPLAALDPRIERHVVHGLFGHNGFLKDKTCIMVTNSFKARNLADSICLVSGRTVIQSVKVQAITEEDPTIRAHPKTLHTEIAADNQDPAHLGSIVLLNNLKPAQSVKTQVSEMGLGNESIQGEELSELEHALSPSDDASLDVETGVVPGKSEMQHKSIGSNVYKMWLESFKLILVLCMLLMFQICGFAATFWLKRLDSSNDAAIQILSVSFILALLNGVSMTLFLFSIYYYCILPACQGFHDALLTAVLMSPVNFTQIVPIGDIATRFTNDINCLDLNLSNTVANLCFIGPSILTILFVMIGAAPALLIVLLPVIYIFFGIQKSFLNLARQLKRIENDSRAPITSHIQETIAGCATIRSLCAFDYFNDGNLVRLEGNMSTALASISVVCWLGTRLDTITVFLQLAATISALLSNMDPSTLGTVLVFMLQLPDALQRYVQFRATLESDMVSLERLLDYDQVSTEDITPLEVKDDGDWPREACLTFRNFSARYQDDLPDCLRGINLNIASGHKVGVLGKTGSGKSSLALAILGAIQTSGGSICIDGKSIADIPLRRLRKVIAIIPQECPLFSGTLSENLDPLGQHQRMDLVKVLINSGLAKHISVEDALDTQMADLGLSIGQVQLVSIARAMLSDAKIVVFDEVTSAIDPETERGIQQAIENAFKGRTVIMIAHRISTVLNSDYILIMHNGEVAEYGETRALMKMKDSKFSDLLRNAQSL